MTELIRYTEKFRSLQGEGRYTGKNTLWLRLFSCNLQCDGFGQADPTDKSSYELSYKEFDVNSINSLHELPVWKRGCDSSYSWSKKFKHLSYQDTPETIATDLMQILTSPSNPKGSFLHDKSGQETHMCFTGGEPLLPFNQKAIVSILEEFAKHEGGIMPMTQQRLDSNLPNYITFETNGTQKLTPEFLGFFDHSYYMPEILMSVSPKLYTVSGETNEKAIKPDVVLQYQNRLSRFGQLKFVIGTEDRQWDELDRIVTRFRDSGIYYPVYIMPVAGRLEEQELIAKEVSLRTLDMGYDVAARVHCYIFGNAMAT